MEKKKVFSDGEIVAALHYVHDRRAVTYVSDDMRKHLVAENLIVESERVGGGASTWYLTVKGSVLAYPESAERFKDEIMEIVMRVKDDDYGDLEYDDLDLARLNDGRELAEKMLDLTAKIGLLPTDVQARLW